MNGVVCCECQHLADKTDAQLVLGDWVCDGCRDTREQATFTDIDEVTL